MRFITCYFRLWLCNIESKSIALVVSGVPPVVVVDLSQTYRFGAENCTIRFYTQTNENMFFFFALVSALYDCATRWPPKFVTIMARWEALPAHCIRIGGGAIGRAQFMTHRSLFGLRNTFSALCVFAPKTDERTDMRGFPR